MPEKPDVQRQLEKAKEDGLAKLRELQREGLLTDALYLAASQRVVSLTLRSLVLLNEAYSQVQGYVTQDGRSEHQAAWLTDKAAALVRELELNVFRVLQEAIQNIRADLPHTKQKVVKEVIYVPPPPLGQVLLRFSKKHQDVLAFLGCLLLGYLSYLVFDNTIWVGLLVPVICFFASRDLWFLEIIFGLVMVMVLLAR
jgi:hypothetical protein